MRLLAGLSAVLLALTVHPTAHATSSERRPSADHAFDVVREGDLRLPGHTILRPRALAEVGFRLPIVVWANGGCRNSNEEYRYFLTQFAAHGYLIIANGPPGNPYRPGELSGIADPQPRKLIEAVDWAFRENARRGSAYRGRLDTSRVIAMGQSCGAWEALSASTDPRIRTTIAWNNGGDPHAGDTTKLRAPTLFVSGGREDYTLFNTVLGYTLTPEHVPAVHADHARAGHVGFWDEPHTPLRDEPAIVAHNWIAMTVYADAVARTFFLGRPCGLCARPDWTVASKNWQ